MSNNYFALPAIVLKIMESVFVMKCIDYIRSCDNQFGFKPSCSTDVRINSLKEYMEYYKNRGTAVYHDSCNIS